MVPTTAAILRLTAPRATARPIARAPERRRAIAGGRLADCLGATALLLALALLLLVASLALSEIVNVAASECAGGLDTCLMRWRVGYAPVSVAGG
jgi:hypothetical protein